MNAPERTQQQLDPAAALGGRIPAVILAVIAVLWTLAFVLVESQHNPVPLLQALTIALLVASAATVAIASAPELAPFGLRSHLIVHLLVLAAFGVDMAIGWGEVRSLHEAWVSGCLGLLLVAISPYRPSRELVVFGTVSAVIIGAGTLLKEHVATAGGTPALALVMIAVLPVLSSCYGAARYSHGMVVDFIRWRNELDASIAAEYNTVRGEIYRRVEKERVASFAADVMPLFRDILRTDSITDDRREQARAIAARLRKDLVTEIDRSWLETATAMLYGSDGLCHEIHDPDDVAAMMNGEQRTAVHALLFALADDPAAAHVVMKLSRGGSGGGGGGGGGGVCRVSLRVAVRGGNRGRHSEYDPYLAVMRTTFDHLSAEFTPRDLIVRFSYAHP